MLSKVTLQVEDMQTSLPFMKYTLKMMETGLDLNQLFAS
jgi:hypothetical protein